MKKAENIGVAAKKGSSDELDALIEKSLRLRVRSEVISASMDKLLREIGTLIKKINRLIKS